MGKVKNETDNKGGRPSTPKEVRVLRRFSKEVVGLRLEEMMRKTLPELKEMLQDHTLPSMDLWLARIILKGIANGDTARLNFMFDRTIGKVKDETPQINQTFVQLDSMPTEEIIRLTKEAMLELESGE